MVDSERLEALRVLTQLYGEGDFGPASQAMPRFIDDESGEKFNDFFDFLQSLYLFQSEYVTMEKEKINSVASSLLMQAENYGYPKNQIEVFLNEDTNT